MVPRFLIRALAGLSRPALLLKSWGERYVETPFVLANLPAAPCSVLDVGCCDSSFSILLSALGYDVTAVDVREWNRAELKLGGWKAADRVRFVRADISKTTELPAASFDAVTIISTLEHIGVGGRYGVEDASGADRSALAELARVAKPGAPVIVTVPFGQKKVIAPNCRIYDRGLIEMAGAAGLSCEHSEFFIQPRPLRWRRAAMEEAESRDVGVENYGLALLRLKKR